MRACLRRAVQEARLRSPRVPIVIQGDSLLVTNQVGGRWACRSPNLLALFEECCALRREVMTLGGECRLEHIFREFNTVADALSNEAVDRPQDCGPRDGW